MASHRKPEGAASPKGLARRYALYPYQERWVADDARFKIAAKSRQIGFTFAAAFGAVRKRLAKPGLTLWLSASQRQSAEAMEHVRRFVTALKIVAEYEDIPFAPDILKLETRFPNGSRIVALPANPDTARGFAGDVILDEFAFHRDAEAIWRSVFATISRGYDLEVISTPAGRLGKYFDLARAAGLVEPQEELRAAGQWKGEPWSAHWSDVYKAVEEGCPLNISELRQAVGDQFTWDQEYCCVFASDADALIPLEQIIAAEDAGCLAVEGSGVQVPDVSAILARIPAEVELYLGGDIGRRRDRTVAWLLARDPLDGLLKTALAISLHGTPFSDQERLLDKLLGRVRRACIDASGLGLQMVESLQAKHGQKVEPVVFSLAVKEDLAMRVVRVLGERLAKVPFAPWVRGGLGAVKRFVTPAGNIRYDAARTEEGHADAFWGFALALHAAQGPALSVELLSAGRLTAGAIYGGGYAAPGIGRSLSQGF